MITSHIIAALLPMSARSMRRWLIRLDGIGLILFDLLDSSLLTPPGILDVAEKVLSSRQEQLWLYYGPTATAVRWPVALSATGSLAKEGKRFLTADSGAEKWITSARSSDDGVSLQLPSQHCCRPLCTRFPFCLRRPGHEHTFPFIELFGTWQPFFRAR
jgi:hypothetical protein